MHPPKHTRKSKFRSLSLSNSCLSWQSGSLRFSNRRSIISSVFKPSRREINLERMTWGGTSCSLLPGSSCCPDLSTGVRGPCSHGRRTGSSNGCTAPGRPRPWPAPRQVSASGGPSKAARAAAGEGCHSCREKRGWLELLQMKIDKQLISRVSGLRRATISGGFLACR